MTNTSIDVTETERRQSPRLLCSDLVRVIWHEPAYQRHVEFAVLETVSPLGAGLLAGVPIPVGARLRVATPDAGFTGVVRHCRHVPNGYLVGISFDLDSAWSEAEYVPEHLLDPRELETEEPQP